MLLSIPGFGVGFGGFVCKLFLFNAAATLGAFACLPGVSIDALANTRLAVAHIVHGTLRSAWAPLPAVLA